MFILNRLFPAYTKHVNIVFRGIVNELKKCIANNLNMFLSNSIHWWPVFTLSLKEKKKEKNGKYVSSRWC